ncbi:MAG: hypothetical protein RMK91_03675 [Pseudanabaenaceae cyanobacterium SKYGB_i_bin29]|nr:hypothetical protein [Pseudanabaenaceae cyanobacterium SKYG29]MDW8420943.1 hypothetical protein [Pseudanabaenaceae cyanobacterium SKYGB_i_bin29]
MAKRRNLKKEKALRNLAYARKFRKRTPSKYMRRPELTRLEEGEETLEPGEDLEGA